MQAPSGVCNMHGRERFIKRTSIIHHESKKSDTIYSYRADYVQTLPISL